MSTTPNFDDEARAELLCYLVVGELVAMARTGEWLRTDHLVESARIWLQANGARCDWQDRVHLARMAAKLAPSVHASFALTTEPALAPLFTDGWMLDYRSPIVCDIHQLCADYVQRS
ncbi:hypothetical protein [Paraburkholderia sediminicola]|uniref:hypothetical protein n=1 Tax=Paraburkholderia sediminicola TaxID=458836 RepID=UPI0038B8B6DF